MSEQTFIQWLYRERDRRGCYKGAVKMVMDALKWGGLKANAGPDACVEHIERMRDYKHSYQEYQAAIGQLKRAAQAYKDKPVIDADPLLRAGYFGLQQPKGKFLK